MADIKWIKITTTMFDDEKIKLIEAMPDADSVLVIWIKLLALAGRCNNFGDVTLSDDMPFSDEMLATIFHRPLNTIRLALSIFAKYKMIQISEKNLQIVNWEKHQNIDGMEKVKEQNRVRNIKYRDRNRLGLNSNTLKNDVSVTSHDGVDIDIDIDIDKNRIDKNRIDNNIEVNFNSLWDTYPIKEGKKQALVHYKAAIEAKDKHEDIEKAVKNYITKVKTENIETRYILHGKTFFNNWKDYLNLEVKKQPTLRSDKPYVKPEYRK